MIFVLCTFAIIAPLLVQGKCPWDWTTNPRTGACYKIINESMRWKTAVQRCASIHDQAELASIRSYEEAYFVKDLLSHAGAKQYWLGGNDLLREGDWRWTDGSPVTINFWSGGSTDNWRGKEHCMSWWRESGMLNDMDCDGWIVRPLCKIPPPKPTCPTCPVVTCPTAKPCPTVAPCPTTPSTLAPTTPAPTTPTPTTPPPTTEAPRTATAECQMVGYEYKGEEIEDTKEKARNAKVCAKRCINNEGCVAWTYVSNDESVIRKERKMCTLLKSVTSIEEAASVSSGYPSKCAFNC